MSIDFSLQYLTPRAREAVEEISIVPSFFIKSIHSLYTSSCVRRLSQADKVIRIMPENKSVMVVLVIVFSLKKITKGLAPLGDPEIEMRDTRLRPAAFSR